MGFHPVIKVRAFPQLFCTEYTVQPYVFIPLSKSGRSHIKMSQARSSLQNVFIPLSKSGRSHLLEVGEVRVVDYTFSSRYQSPGVPTEEIEYVLGEVSLGFHPVIKVRAFPLFAERRFLRDLRFHPVIKVRAFPLYPYNPLSCKRNLGSFRRGFFTSPKIPYF